VKSVNYLKLRVDSRHELGSGCIHNETNTIVDFNYYKLLAWLRSLLLSSTLTLLMMENHPLSLEAQLFAQVADVLFLYATRILVTRVQSAHQVLKLVLKRLN